MFNDEFKRRYTTIPFATHSKRYEFSNDKKSVDTFVHNHREIELLVITEGEVVVHIAENEYTLSVGDIAIVKPYALHWYTINGNSDCCTNCVCFDLTMLKDEMLSNSIEKGILALNPIIKGNKEATEYILAAIKANREQKRGWEYRIIGYMNLLFALLYENGEIFEPHNRVASEEFYLRVLEFVNNNFQKNITSSDIAKELFMSNSYFCRKFKKIFSMCFQNYICVYRIEKSKNLLCTTAVSISEIAAEVGFNDWSYYTKKFREYTGFTPSEFRKKHRR